MGLLFADERGHNDQGHQTGVAQNCFLSSAGPDSII